MKGKTFGRLLAWLLCVTLPAACVPTAFAEDNLPTYEATQSEPDKTPCEHVPADERQTDWVITGEYRIEEDTHAAIKAEYVVTVCALCGEEMDREPTGEEAAADAEPHDFGEGDVCAVCGYRKAVPAAADEATPLSTGDCPHANKYLTYGNMRRNEKYTPNDNGKSHHIEYDRYESYYCEDCGQTVEEFKEKVSWDELCSFYCPNSDSLVKCLYCGREKTCTHEGKKLMNTDSRTRIVNCTPNGDGETHHIIYERSDEYYCKNCESYISVFREQAETDEPCTYYCPNSDSLLICAYCGREKTCEHHEKELVGSDSRTFIKFTPNDDGKSHHIVYDRSEEYRCKNCGTYFSVFKERAETDEPCTFYCPNSDSLVICSDCGRQKTCEHEWKEQRSEIQQGELMPNGDGTHTRAYVLRYERHCSLCGVYEKPWESDPYTMLEQCLYSENDGICTQCHAPAACAHELTRTYTYKDQIANYVPNGDGTHTYAYTQCTVEQCIRCGKYVSEIREEPGKTEIKRCRFFNGDGICIDCGYDRNGCTHSDPTRRRYMSVIDPSDPGTFTPNADGLTHTVTLTYGERVQCLICGAYIDGEADTKTKFTSVEKHIFQDGVCVDCKYKRECAHPNAYDRVEERAYNDNNVVARDANGHTREYWIYKARFCPDCNMWLETQQLTGERTTYVEDHGFDANGQCFTCGYVTVCAHQHTYESYGTWEIASTTQVDEIYHRTFYDHRIGVYCADCGASLGTETVRTDVPTLERHYFLQGKCQDCGYELACAHTRTKIERELVGEYQITARDEHAHTAKYQVEETTRCADCGELLGIKRETAQEFAVAHDWWNRSNYRVCTVCGYREAFDKTACPHAHTSREQDEIENVTAQADGHLVTYGEMAQHTWCDDCGAYLGKQNTGTNGTVLEPHEFENGKCTVCGYVNPCGHDGERAVYAEYRLARNVRDNGDGTHTMVADVWTHTYCKRCGEDLSVELARNQTVRAAHDMENGACIYCYAKAQQTPPAPPQSGSDDGGSSGGGRTGNATAVQPAEPPVIPQQPAATRELAVSLNSIALQLAVSPSATIEIVGAEEIMTDAEYQRFDGLSLSEQIMVVLSVAGVTQDITSTLPPSAMLLTADAQALIAQITGRVETGEAVPVQFKIGDVTVNGVPCKCVTITFVITMDGVQMRTTRSFYFDLTQGEWVAMDALAVV